MRAASPTITSSRAGTSVCTEANRSPKTRRSMMALTGTSSWLRALIACTTRSWPSENTTNSVAMPANTNAIGSRMIRPKARIMGTPRLRAPSRIRDRALARAQFQALRLELAARCHDVAATRGAHRARVARPVHHLSEALDLLPVRTLVRRAGPRIERDQIDLGRDARKQLDERPC